jgi:polyphosphate kinase
LGRRGNLIPGGRIHNFRHFMEFPESVFRASTQKNKPFTHPELKLSSRVTDIVLRKDLLLHFPYHSFNAIIDLLREAAMDPEVAEIKITAYRLAENSKIINALINAHRNGKRVVVMLELRARFDEEANLSWKERLEDEGVKVLVGIPNIKVHAKLCVITRKKGAKTLHYGFVSTGNLHEKTAKIYGDHCLLTSDRNIMTDINRIFEVLEKPKINTPPNIPTKTLMVSPVKMRKEIILLINNEIKEAKAGRHAELIIKINSLADELLIAKIDEAALAGVHVKLIVRGIMTFKSENPKFLNPVQAISIVDQYLEHARVWIFHNAGKERVFIASADWMVRNLDHRIEAAVEIKDNDLKNELREILAIQLRDNVKARILDNRLNNHYSKNDGRKVRSQIETYNYLMNKIQGGKKK